MKIVTYSPFLQTRDILYRFSSFFQSTTLMSLGIWVSWSRRVEKDIRVEALDTFYQELP